jgi:hypothetical protein
MKDVDFILHLASPFFIASDDPLKDLIEPTVNVTKNVVASALNSPNSHFNKGDICYCSEAYGAGEVRQ